MQTIRSILVAACVLHLSAIALADVLVVDGPGPGFADIQSAVDAAADGDTILVEAGTYPSFTIAGKGLTVVADTGALVTVDGGILVEDTAVQHRIVLRNLVAIGDQSDPTKLENGLRLVAASGPVRVEGCTLTGSEGDDAVLAQEEPGKPGVFADGALDLSLHRCTLTGGDGDLALLGGLRSAGGHGMEVQASRVALHHCQLVGGLAAAGDEVGDGAPGGHGLWAHEPPGTAGPVTTVFAAGCDFRGTDGTTDDFCFVSGDGGSGVLLEGASTSATLLDNTYAFGLKGSCGINGTDGEEIEADAGATFVLLPGEARDVVARSPIRELEPLILSFRGEPGDAAFLLLSAGPAQAAIPSLSGVLLLELPLLGGVVPAGTIPASGSLNASLGVGLLPDGVSAATLYLQSIFQDASGDVWLASPTTPILLDQSL